MPNLSKETVSSMIRDAVIDEDGITEIVQSTLTERDKRITDLELKVTELTSDGLTEIVESTLSESDKRITDLELKVTELTSENKF